MININKLFKKCRNDLSLVAKEATLLEQRGQLDDAIQIYQALIQKLPKKIDLQEVLGTCQLKAGQFDKSIRTFEKVLRLGSSKPQVYLHKGTAEARIGLAREAEGSFLKALDLRPDYALAENNLGSLYNDIGKTKEAIEQFDKALQIDPEYKDALYNLGVASHAAGQYEKGLVSLEKLLAIEKDHARGMFFRELTLYALGHMSQHQLEERVRQLLELCPLDVEILNGLGTLLLRQNRTDEALMSLSKAIDIDPVFTPARVNRGQLLNRTGRCVEAIQDLYAALSTNPLLTEAHVNLSFSLASLGRFNEALSFADQAINLNSGLVSAQVNRAAALIRLSRFKEALLTLNQTVEQSPRSVEALNARAGIYLVLDNLDAAQEDAKKAVTLEPGFIPAIQSFAAIHTANRNYDQAHHQFNRASLIDSQNADTRLSRALLLLTEGHLDQGFAEYEWRQKTARLGQYRNFPYPLWLGESSLAEKKMLVSCEQGLGDFLQFCRYLPKISEIAREVVVETHPTLRRLMTSLKGHYQWINLGGAPPRSDLHCPLMSLPLAFKTTLESIPNPGAYLSADTETVEKWQNRLGPASRPRIGLVWSGSSAFANDHTRSIPFENLADLLALDAFEFHVLQKEIRESEYDLVKATPNLYFHGNDLDDFMETAGLLEAMDLVISVDTSVAHLAGALGKKVWILLPFAPDFRWLLDRSDSPWYSSAKLFRQKTRGDWKSVLADLEIELTHNPT
jgi:tetratricopeptide (TPR) repeat protein